MQRVQCKTEGSVKVVHEIATGRVYFVSFSRYQLHFDFCREELGYTRRYENFNDDQYTGSSLRLYYPVSVDHT